MAAVPFSAPFDLTDSAGHHGPEFVRFLERHVLGGRFDDHPERFISYSPYERIHLDAPPFFVLRGDLDTLVQVADARRFVARLREVSRSPVAYAEVPGAEHAFEVFRSPRTNQAVESVRVFLDHGAAGQPGVTASARDLVEVGCGVSRPFGRSQNATATATRARACAHSRISAMRSSATSSSPSGR